MGGNARALNKVTGEETLAQKIPLEKIGRQKFIKKFIEIFEKIDELFYKKFKKHIWKNKSILRNGVAFNGSTSFIMNPEIPDEQVIPYKKTAGDIDVMVPEEYKYELWELLNDLEKSPKILPGVIYKGNNKLSPSMINDQINAVFEVHFDDIVTFSQVDFEFVEFEEKDGEEVPLEFSRFGHSSSLADAQMGFKGVLHKYLLRSLASGASIRDNILILTPNSTVDNPRFKKTKGEHLTKVSVYKFSVANGLRVAYELQYKDGKPFIYDGKKVYKEIPTKDSNYETSVKQIFKMLFNDEDAKDLDKMWSFVGLVKLMKKYLDNKNIEDVFERFILLCWGSDAQRLERDHKEIDFEIKSVGVNYLIKNFPFLSKYKGKIDKMVQDFYDNYHKQKISESILYIDSAFKYFLLNGKLIKE